MKKVLRDIGIIDLIAINLVIALLAYVVFTHNMPVSAPNNNNQEKIAELEKKLAALDNKQTADTTAVSEKTTQEQTSTSKPTPTPVVKYVTAPTRAPTKSVSYIAVPGNSFSTTKTTWTDVLGSNFYLDVADYPGYSSAIFEANIKLINGNGKAYIRIYDITHSREVDNSTLETASQSLIIQTGGPLSLWAGNNEYKIQVRTLTADTAVFDSGRIKLVTEN